MRFIKMWHFILFESGNKRVYQLLLRKKTKKQ